MADPNQVNPNPFRIWFEDQHLVVLSKEPNLLSQSDHTGVASLVDLLRLHFGRNYVGLVHRLDRNTSGLMIVAKRSKSAERLTEQLQKGFLTRAYHAILWGEFPSRDSREHWEDWLLKNEATNRVRAVAPNTKGAKVSSLWVTPLKTLKTKGAKMTLARFELESGRSHQIRVQSQAAGHPLIGDSKYGNPQSSSLFFRPALHSCEIQFLHPMTEEKMSFQDPFPPDFLAAFPELFNDL